MSVDSQWILCPACTLVRSSDALSQFEGDGSSDLWPGRTSLPASLIVPHATTAAHRASEACYEPHGNQAVQRYTSGQYSCLVGAQSLALDGNSPEFALTTVIHVPWSHAGY